MNIIIPMVGLGSRFQKEGYTLPKPLIEVLGKTLIEHSIDSFDVEGKFIFITRDFHNAEHNIALSNILKAKRPESVEIKLKRMTSGAAESALAAKELINNNEPLVIYNCDQSIDWDPNEFLKTINQKKPDAALVLYNSTDPKNSFAEIVNNVVTRLVEKQAVSEHALIGFHYWARGKDFVNSAEALIDNFRVEHKNECYISETFNYMKDKHILPYHVNSNVYIPLGTPEDVARYVGKVKEFTGDKPKSIFIDIDGTLLKHMHTISDVYSTEAIVLPGVIEKLNEWDSQGYKVILTTARKESTRQLTEDQLRKFGIAWDFLIMGVGGRRYIINDKLSEKGKDRAVGINVITNEGFKTVDWKDYDL
jgi:NDP-sugar pyrophosphorylase family protein